jgi:hypothetical protein
MPFRKVPTLFLEGLMSSFSLGYLRTFCPRKSKPCSTYVMTVLVGESSRRRSCRNCLFKIHLAPPLKSMVGAEGGGGKKQSLCKWRNHSLAFRWSPLAVFRDAPREFLLSVSLPYDL